MSDMQKGLQQVVKDLLPNCERRMCARHIWSNWNHNWRGEERRKQFWRVAKSSFVVKVNDEMAELAKLGLGKDICEDLLHYPKEAWCRAYFQEHSKCDAVENNMCETFNSWILGPRHKSIISMLEDIRHKIMARQVDMIQFAETWISDISPMARHTLDQNKDMSRDCSVKWNADSGFEIVEKEKYGHTVDLRKKTCSCRSWMLRGIPCQHAVCAYYHLGKEPEDYVEKWYRKDYFLKAYKYYIQPIPNMKMWLPTNNMTIEPPALKPMPGRPKRCRRKAKDEPKKWGKISRKGAKMTCSKCHQQGHNKNFCSSRTGMEMPPQSAGPSRQPAGPSNQPAAITGLSSQAAGPSSLTSTSVCADYSAVRRKSQIPHRGRGRGKGRGGGRGTGSGRGSSSNTNTIGGQKRSRGATGFGLYTDRNGSQVLNPGTMGERLLFGGSQVKHAAETNGDIGFKPRGLRWMGKNAVTTSQLQQMRYSQSKQFGVSSSATGSTNPSNI